MGAASTILTTLCTSCQPVSKGYRAVTASQAQMLLKNQGYVDVQAASGELAGKLVTVKHFVFTVPVCWDSSRQLGRAHRRSS